MQRYILMADLLSFNQPLIVLERRKKKGDLEEEPKPPTAAFLFPALDEGREGEEAAKAFFLFFLACG